MSNEPLTGAYPRVEAGDTYKFIKRVPSLANSAAVSIYDPNGTVISSLQVASYDNVNSYYYHHYTTTTSWFTTVDSYGQHITEWILYRDTGNDLERNYFEVIRID